MPLTPEEEKRLREEIRKKLEEREKRRRESKSTEEAERLRRLEEQLRAQIKAEEEEKYYTEKGYVRYVNRYGETEWISREDAERRHSERRSKKKPSRTKKKKMKKMIRLAMNILVFTIAGIVVLFVYKKMKPGKTPGYGKVVVQSDIPGARIFANGRELDALTPDTMGHIGPGRYYVSVYKEGFSAWPPMMEVQVKANKTVVADFDLIYSSYMGSAIIQADRQGFELFVDGIRNNIAGGRIKVPAGYHVFAVVKKGYIASPLYRRVLIERDKEVIVDFRFVQPEEIGYLQISSSGGDEFVFIDGKFTGLKANGKLIPVAASIYDVSIRKNGFVSTPETEMINVLGGQEKLIVFQSRKTDERRKVQIQTKNPGAVIILDGEITPFVTPLVELELSPGAHFLNLLRDETLYSQTELVLEPEKLKDNKIFIDF